MKLTKLSILLACSSLALLLNGCGSNPAPDMHDLPRETKPYESVDPTTLDLPALKAHLKTLAAEADEAIANGQWVELHHVEVALTPTLDAIKAKLGSPSPEATQFIDSLKTVAIKLHDAGHNENAAMAKTLNAKLQSSVSRMDMAIP